MASLIGGGMARLRLTQILVLMALLLAASAAHAAGRVALVIGVSKYSNPDIPSLANPASDARMIAETLTSAGFQVDLKVDPTRAQVLDAMAKFEPKAKASDAAVIYYAGHGVEIQGKNYLVPADAKLGNATAFAASAVNTLSLRRTVLGARRLRLVILDACRNNPVGEGKGLAREEGEGIADMVVLMAAAPGQTAADGDDGHSPFATALARAVRLTGLIVGELPRFVQAEVQRDFDQSPDLQGIWRDINWTFTPSPAAQAAGDQTAYRISQENADRLYWESVRDSSDPEDFNLYIQKSDRGELPGLFRGLAIKRVNALTQRKPVQTASASRPLPSPIASPPVPQTSDLVSGRDAFARGDYASAERAWQRAAQASNGPAMYNLGVMRFFGKGRARDLAGAAGWFQKAANAGYPSGMLNYALCLLNGYGVAKNDAQAVQWMRRAADQGSSTAMARMGDIYLDGRGVKQDERQAAQWLQRATDAGDGPAATLLASFYEEGVGVRADKRRAFQLYSQAASGGETDAMVRLGYFYEDGVAVEQDVTQAAAWYQRAAAGGNGEGMASLGVLYETGQGLPQDYSLAIQNYQAALARKHPRGYLGMGSLYLRGLGVRQNDKEAFRLFKLAADAGSATGMRNVALMYLGGRGTAANPGMARSYFQKGAEAGDQASAEELAKMQ